MGDYGHDLTFGTFITPSAREPQHAVDLAVATEEAGLDLVTFQDHPYQPAFLDTLTLLAYVAARTERVQLAANVANLPLRPPAVLARAVASLDLLSGGRAVLGLGAGAFWDAIVAMGGRRLEGGQAVQALQEAIEVVRTLWDTSVKGGVRIEGEHYQVVGAKRGPAPAHDVPIWVGAGQPRMLRLVGRLADGWLPSLGWLGDADAIDTRNAIIDEAAVRAGRLPADIRRLVNVDQGSATPERLAELALRHGFATFILASDDREAIEWYGKHTAPAVREAVAPARSQRLGRGSAQAGARCRRASSRSGAEVAAHHQTRHPAGDGVGGADDPEACRLEHPPRPHEGHREVHAPGRVDRVGLHSRRPM
jgi:alkanesulfonate monooxygenase SsuD/methylene tetrahydromethanopterin reductase-like flavin-dependent oxidoreductase (luciferase family)